MRLFASIEALLLQRTKGCYKTGRSPNTAERSCFLGHTAIEMETNRSMGRDFDSEDFANSFLSNFGIAMLSAAAPAGMRAGSQVLDAMTGGGVRKMREKANQYALKLANIPADAARNAPVIKEIRSRLQKFANPDARQMTELRYQVNKARAEGVIDYDHWVNYQNILSNAEMGTETSGSSSILALKSCLTQTAQ